MKLDFRLQPATTKLGNVFGWIIFFLVAVIVAVLAVGFFSAPIVYP